MNSSSNGKLNLIPSLVNGFLPSGIHECSLDEIEAVFAQSNPSPRRPELWAKFVNYVNWIRPMGFFQQIYVDGSFTTDKHDPGDIDVVLQIPQPSVQLQARMQANPEIPKAWDVSYAKTVFEIHPFLWYQGLPPDQSFIEFFQGIRPEEARRLNLPVNTCKGILKVKI